VKPLTSAEVLSIADYERIRSRLRPVLINEKNRRRLALGEHLTFLFENGSTLWYQIHEILRTEKIAEKSAVEHEVETYNSLLPGAQEISATLLIEYADPAERDAALRKLIGLERHLWLVIGGQRHAARFDEGQISPDQISAVQFIRFPAGKIEPQEFLDLANAGKVALELDHPKLQERAPIKGALAAALAEDLRGD
jgi:hypothetical protein